MKVCQIKCEFGHRLFDAIDGSNLKIRIKCGNQKICPHKVKCKRETEVTVGKAAGLGNYKHMSCPACNKRIFDIAMGSDGLVQIKCVHCLKVIDLPIGIGQ